MKEVAAKLKESPVGKDTLVAQIDVAKYKSLGKKFAITSIPSLHTFSTWPAEGATADDVHVSYGKYPDAMEADAIANYIHQQMDSNRVSYPFLEVERRVGKVSATKRKQFTPYETVTAENFDALVMDATKDVVVQFSAPVTEICVAYTLACIVSWSLSSHSGARIPELCSQTSRPQRLCSSSKA
jgi:hypothetical protein